MSIEFPPGTGWIQRAGRGFAVTPDPDARIYLVRGGRAVELVSQVDPTESDETPGEGLGMAVNQTDEE